ncbi:FUSC family protein [Bosea thiooxidans]
MSQIFERLGLDRAAIRQGLLLALAAMIAFGLAAMLHVRNAYWAAMPVFVIAQPMRGLVFERGLFRLLGTLAGAGVGLCLLQLAPHPLAMLALLGVWVGVNAALTHMLSGVQGYAALLAGMTAAVVMIPSVFDPGHGLPLAVARAECTLIGVIVAILIIGFATPRSPRDAFLEEVRDASDAVLREIAVILRGQGALAGERGLLRRLAELQDRGTLVFAGSLRGYRSLHHLQVLLVAALGAMVEARSLRRRDPDRAEIVAEALNREPDGTVLLSAMADPADRALADELTTIAGARQAIEQASPSEQALSWQGLRPRLAFFFDPAIAGWVGLLAGAATFLASWAAYGLGWPEAELTALGVCIFAMVLGSLPRPRAVAPVMLRGVLVGVFVAVLYRLAVQPWVVNLPLLLVTLAPFVVLGGLARASGRFGAPALDANMCFLLAGQAGAPAAERALTVLSGSLALAVAVAIATTAVRLLPDPNRFRHRNARRAIERDLARIAGDTLSETPANVRRRTSRQLMRLALHLGRASAPASPEDGSLVALLETGTVLGRLRAMAKDARVDAGDRIQIAKVLAAAARPSTGVDDAERVALAAAFRVADASLAAELRSFAAAIEEGRRALEVA